MLQVKSVMDIVHFWLLKEGSSDVVATHPGKPVEWKGERVAANAWLRTRGSQTFQRTHRKPRQPNPMSGWRRSRSAIR